MCSACGLAHLITNWKTLKVEKGIHTFILVYWVMCEIQFSSTTEASLLISFELTLRTSGAALMLTMRVVLTYYM